VRNLQVTLRHGSGQFLFNVNHGGGLGLERRCRSLNRVTLGGVHHSAHEEGETCEYGLEGAVESDSGDFRKSTLLYITAPRLSSLRAQLSAPPGGVEAEAGSDLCWNRTHVGVSYRGRREAH
jgi:hypothetical protein